MTENKDLDYYEILQVSNTAEPETINRIYRLFAQRFHPDNQETGDVAKFRLVHEAYTVLSDPIRRAQYDIVYERLRHERWRLVSTGSHAQDDFELERVVRLTVLEVLYTRRRVEPAAPTLYPTELETLTGQPREHLEFTLWYLVQKGLIQKTDDSRLALTVEGADFLEENYRTNPHRRRLEAHYEHR